jgi:hypothetical protein
MPTCILERKLRALADFANEKIITVTLDSYRNNLDEGIYQLVVILLEKLNSQKNRHETYDH